MFCLHNIHHCLYIDVLYLEQVSTILSLYNSFPLWYPFILLITHEILSWSFLTTYWNIYWIYTNLWKINRLYIDIIEIELSRQYEWKQYCNINILYVFVVSHPSTRIKYNDLCNSSPVISKYWFHRRQKEHTHLQCYLDLPLGFRHWQAIVGLFVFLLEGHQAVPCVLRNPSNH